MNIIIPTLGRVDNQVTLDNIPAKHRDKVVLVVQEHEYDTMKEKYDVRVWKLPTGTKGIAWTRYHIAQEFKGQRNFILDDDLKFVKIDGETLKATTFGEAEFDEMVDQINQKMDEYVFGGLSTHNTPPSDKPFSECTRIYTNVFYNEKFDPDTIDWGTQYELMPEDFHVTLQLLERGVANVVFNHFRANASATQSKGGCETFRTLENHNRGQEILAELHPNYVTVYDKEVPSGPWKGAMKKALKIKWKQAYTDSQKNEMSLEDFF